MAYAAYLLTLDAGSAAATKIHGASSMIVCGNSEDEAKQIAAAKYDGEGAIWLSATATAITSAADWEGWNFKITVHTATPKVFSYTGTSTNDTIDEIAAALVTLINADADIAGAAYNATTQVLKVAETTDNLGAAQLTVEITPPGGFSPVAALVGTIVDGGEAAAVLSVVLPADAIVPPAFIASCNVVS